MLKCEEHWLPNTLHTIIKRNSGNVAKHLFLSHENEIVVQIYSAKLKLKSARAWTKITRKEKEERDAERTWARKPLRSVLRPSSRDEKTGGTERERKKRRNEEGALPHGRHKERNLAAERAEHLAGEVYVWVSERERELVLGIHEKKKEESVIETVRKHNKSLIFFWIFSS